MSRLEILAKKCNLDVNNINEMKSKVCQMLYVKRTIEYNQTHGLGKSTDDMNNYIEGLVNFDDDISKKYTDIINKVQKIDNIDDLEIIYIEQNLNM